MAISGDVAIKVKSDELVNTADALLIKINRASACCDELSRIIDRTSGYWIGEAGDFHRNMYNSQKDAINTMFRRLKEHPTDLKAIAGNYDIGEQKNISTTDALAINPIQ